LLRAAVILLHATLEDLLRSLAELWLPSAQPEPLETIPLPVSTDRVKNTFNLGDLATHRGTSVDDVIRKSVVAYLARSSYNHPGDIKNVLDSVGINRKHIDPHARVLAAMMNRRHYTAHRADRNEVAGVGHHLARSISKSSVESWIATVEAFGETLIDELPSDGHDIERPTP